MALVAALIAGWPVVLSRFGGGDVYVPLGLYSLLVIAVVVGLRRFRMGDLATRWKTNALAGLVVGSVMTLATYLAYDGAVAVAPSLAPHVEGLYRSARTTSLGVAIGLTTVAVFAEELLWRDAFVQRATPRLGLRGALLLSLATYSLAQCSAGSWVVVLAALVCGAIWTVERWLTRTIVASLVSHLIWTITVVHLHPVTRQ